MIRAESVTKCFGSLTAVNGVSFSLERGQVVGFVGPNGAGKSTLMKMLATFLVPTSGKITVDDVDAIADPLEVRRRIGYLAGDTPLYRDMRTDRFLEFIGRAHGMSGAHLEQRMRSVVEACDLGEALTKKIGECSTGFRRRIGLAGSLIHDPGVILLDEPTHGLDPLQVLAFRDLVKKLRAGRTILISSHLISEVAHISDRVLLIRDGRLLADGKVDELCAKEKLAKDDLEGLFVKLIRDDEKSRAKETANVR